MTEPKKTKRERFRTKSSRRELLKKLEALFCEGNLKRNSILVEEIKKSSDGFISLDNVLHSNCISKGRLSSRGLVDLSQKSSVIEISNQDGVLKIRQKCDTSHSDLSTVYVDDIPEYADVAWLEKVFSKFGTIAKVDLPVFKRKLNGRKKDDGKVPIQKHKGFAFVEFVSENAALNSLKAFAQSSNPNKPTTSNQQGESVDSSSVVAVSSDEPAKKRRKMSPDLAETEQFLLETPTDGLINSSLVGDKNDKGIKIGGSSKRKRLRRKTRRDRVAGARQKGKLKSALMDSSFLKVYSLKEWKELKEKYLNKQKRNFSELKLKLNGRKLLSADKLTQYVNRDTTKMLRKMRGREKISLKRDVFQEEQLAAAR